jgi:hypothetical protein
VASHTDRDPRRRLPAPPPQVLTTIVCTDRGAAGLSGPAVTAVAFSRKTAGKLDDTPKGQVAPQSWGESRSSRAALVGSLVPRQLAPSRDPGGESVEMVDEDRGRDTGKDPVLDYPAAE